MIPASSKQAEVKRLLVEELSGSELQSLLINVFTERAAPISSATLLEAWERDRFVSLAPVSPRDLAELDVVAFKSASAFEAVELAPVCPLGTNTSVAPMSQNKVLATIRNTEVVADSTNVMALECAIRRRKLLKLNPKNAEIVRLCASHRLLRTQKFSGPGMLAHFRVFSLCSAGRDVGNFGFETQTMAEQISVYCQLFNNLREAGFDIRGVSLGIYGEEKRLVSKLISAIERTVPVIIPVKRLGKRNTNYYPTASFALNFQTRDGKELNIGDGGFVDWTQKLVSSTKERLMISGIGSERLILQCKSNRLALNGDQNG